MNQLLNMLLSGYIGDKKTNEIKITGNFFFTLFCVLVRILCIIYWFD